MKNNFFKSLVSGIMMMMVSHSIHAQPIYKINDSNDIDMKLSGTSTLHTWAMEAKTFEGEAQFGFKPNEDTKLTSLKSLTFSLDVKDLKSHEKKMDENAYKALKTDQYRDITYRLTSAILYPEKENKYMVKTLGKLSIAGITKEVAMNVYCMVNKDNTVTITGSDKLKMTDYQVKPPTFMLGAMKTGDNITLDFTLVYKK